MRVLSIILFILSMGMCIYDAHINNMMCVVWAVNAMINFHNLKLKKS